MGEYLDVNGLKTYFERRGTGDPVLLLHGGASTCEWLAPLAKGLEASYSLVQPERRWHGRTACVGTELTYEIMTADTITFMDTLDITTAHLIGQSDGANIAAMIAIQRPDLVRKVVMMGGNFNTDYLTAETKRGLLGVTPEQARKAFPETVRLYFEVQPDAEARFPVLLAMLMKTYASDWRIPVESLTRIAAPTLVICGDRDSVPLTHTQELFRAIPKAQLCVVPNASHSFAREKPELVSSVIHDFLRA